MSVIHFKFSRLLKQNQLINLREFTICLVLIIVLLVLFISGLPSKPVAFYSFFDDSNVDASRYRDDYRDQNEKFSEIIDKRNMENYENKVIISSKRQIGKPEYSILMYTTVFGEQKFCDRSINDLILPECPYKNCKFECDKSKVLDADAVLFSERDLSQLGTEETYEIKNNLQTHSKRAQQVWILFNDEPTISPKMNNYQFNWTMSYRIDAEVSDCSYGCAYTLPKKQIQEYKLFADHYRIIFYQRKHKAIWAVSNCHASARMKFALEMSKHMPVKVIGYCANYFLHANSWIPTFFRNYFLNEVVPCPRGSICEKELFEKSKFYFSFESYNCQDYITEKLWRILRTNMIPVVIQPSKAVYSLILPPDSFIHAEDFDFDPEKLAEHLKIVSTDFNVYLKYHAWKFDFDVVFSAQQAEKRRLCELCTKLNEETSSIYYKSIANWFNDGCRKGFN